MADLEEHDRPREKISSKGAGSLNDEELIAAILGRGTKNNDILSLSRDIANLIRKNPDAGYNDFLKVNGIGPSKASLLVACFELCRRYGKIPEIKPVRISNPSDLLNIHEIEEIRRSKQENFIVITINGASEVINTRLITKGILTQSLVHPREVFSDAIIDRAYSIIAVHNHPSGSTTPSTEDQIVTEKLYNSGKILGISLLDHVIVTKNAYYSMVENGVFSNFR